MNKIYVKDLVESAFKLIAIYTGVEVDVFFVVTWLHITVG